MLSFNILNLVVLALLVCAGTPIFRLVALLHSVDCYGCHPICCSHRPRCGQSRYSGQLCNSRSSRGVHRAPFGDKSVFVWPGCQTVLLKYPSWFRRCEPNSGRCSFRVLFDSLPDWSIFHLVSSCRRAFCCLICCTYPFYSYPCNRGCGDCFYRRRGQAESEFH